MNLPTLTQLEFIGDDFDTAERIAKSLGYAQAAYTSTSALIGLFCLKENPLTWGGPKQALTSGCVIKTQELGFLFVQDLEDLNLYKEHERQIRAEQGNRRP